MINPKMKLNGTKEENAKVLIEDLKDLISKDPKRTVFYTNTHEAFSNKILTQIFDVQEIERPKGLHLDKNGVKKSMWVEDYSILKKVPKEYRGKKVVTHWYRLTVKTNKGDESKVG